MIKLVNHVFLKWSANRGLIGVRHLALYKNLEKIIVQN